MLGFSFDGAAFHGFLRDAQGSFTAIDMPGAEQRGTLAFGFNNRDQIVGLALVLDGDQLTSPSFVLENGTFTTIDVPDAQLGTVVLDVSDQGQFAGAYDPVGHGFLRERDGDFRVVDPPEGNINEVLGINNRGQIVGNYSTTANNTAYPTRGFLLNARGEFTLIDVPGSQHIVPVSINNRGQVVGEYQDAWRVRPLADRNPRHRHRRARPHRWRLAVIAAK